jgi:hypothetical protein
MESDVASNARKITQLHGHKCRNSKQEKQFYRENDPKNTKAVTTEG